MLRISWTVGGPSFGNWQHWIFLLKALLQWSSHLHCNINAYLEEDERLRDPHLRPNCATGSSQPPGIDVRGPRTDSWGYRYHSRNRRRRGWNMNSGNWQIRPRRRSWPFLTETNEEKLWVLQEKKNKKKNKKKKRSRKETKNNSFR